MKPEVVRQPLLASLAFLLLVVAAALAWGDPVGTTAAAPTPLGDLLRTFQNNFPVWSKAIAALLLITSGIRIGRLTIRYTLYPVGTSLAIPLYGVVACGILTGTNYLAEFTASYLLLLSTRAFFAGYRNGYAIGVIFRASLCLGLLPLVYAPALPLTLLIAAAVFCFRRTGREAFVALCGVILPTLATCYITWALEGNFLDTPLQMWDSLTGDGGFRLFGHIPLLAPALLGVVLFTVLCAVFFSFAGFRAQNRRSKAILVYTIILFMATGALALLPCATPGLMAIIALPAAILMPQTFVHIHRTGATLLFILLYGLCIANLFLQ